MKAGDLVTVKPAKIGYFIVLGKTEMDIDYVGRTVYWDLVPLTDSHRWHNETVSMDERYIEIINEV